MAQFANNGPVSRSVLACWVLAHHHCGMKTVLCLLCCCGTLLFGGEVSEKKISVTLDVPSTAWTLSIESVYQLQEEVWVVARVKSDPHVMGAMAITTLEESVMVTAADLPVKKFVLGKTWNWESEGDVTFVKTLEDLQPQLKGAVKVYPK